MMQTISSQAEHADFHMFSLGRLQTFFFRAFSKITNPRLVSHRHPLISFPVALSSPLFDINSAMLFSLPAEGQKIMEP